MRDIWVIWPIYFDADASRREGRRLPKEKALSNPQVDDIVKAAKQLGLNPIKEGKSYPSRWWRKEGRVLVNRERKKIEILESIAEKIKQDKIGI